MRQLTYKKAELIALKYRGAQYIVVQKHEVAGISAGTVLSWHKSNEAACRHCEPGGFSAIQDINDAICDASE